MPPMENFLVFACHHHIGSQVLLNSTYYFQISSSQAGRTECSPCTLEQPCNKETDETQIFLTFLEHTVFQLQTKLHGRISEMYNVFQYVFLTSMWGEEIKVFKKGISREQKAARINNEQKFLKGSLCFPGLQFPFYLLPSCPLSD